MAGASRIPYQLDGDCLIRESYDGGDSVVKGCLIEGGLSRFASALHETVVQLEDAVTKHHP